MLDLAGSAGAVVREGVADTDVDREAEGSGLPGSTRGSLGVHAVSAAVSTSTAAVSAEATSRRRRGEGQLAGSGAGGGSPRQLTRESYPTRGTIAENHDFGHAGVRQPMDPIESKVLLP